MDVQIKAGKLIITLNMTEPTLSKGGKMHMVASTGGFKESSAKVDGKNVKISVNAGIVK